MPRARTCKLGILVSGRGSNMLSIIRSVESGEVKGAEVAVDVRDAEVQHDDSSRWLVRYSLFPADRFSQEGS